MPHLSCFLLPFCRHQILSQGKMPEHRLLRRRALRLPRCGAIRLLSLPGNSPASSPCISPAPLRCNSPALSPGNSPTVVAVQFACSVAVQFACSVARQFACPVAVHFAYCRCSAFRLRPGRCPVWRTPCRAFAISKTNQVFLSASSPNIWFVFDMAQCLRTL